MKSNPQFRTDTSLKEKFNNPAKYAELAKLDYFWAAFLGDGNIVTQFDDEGNEVLFKEIYKEEMMENLESVYWIPSTGGVSHGIELKTNQKVIILRRNHIRLEGGERTKKTVFMLGFKEDEKKELIFISGDGRTKITSDFEYNFL